MKRLAVSVATKPDPLDKNTATALAGVGQRSCRLAKEKLMYEKETVQEEEKVEKMKADGRDEHDVKKQVWK